MNRFWTHLIDARVLSLIGLAALVAFLFLGADAMQVAVVWVAIVLALLGGLTLVAWLVRRVLARRAARGLETALEHDAQKAAGQAGDARSGRAKGEVAAEVAQLRTRLQDAIRTIKGSRLGQTTGSAALYELPWYMVIGNPAAGKSTAIVKSGLQFPFADGGGNGVQGVGGTRDCDWFFTSEGILLDTAGRYSVHEEDRAEWHGFLDLLRRHRPKAPINGVLIAVSVAELVSARPELSIQLAKSLRQRVQELTERLEIHAPVYVVFTKADLIAGFIEFFEDQDRDERDAVWGATLPYEQTEPGDAVARFDRHFDELRSGLKEKALARLALQRGRAVPPGVLTFPLEFASMKPALRDFIATLFEENPYQYKPVFRGFYFTSALQEGQSTSRARDAVARAFALSDGPAEVRGGVVAEHGFFLKGLFSKVVFADRNLVRRHANAARQRLRTITFALAAGALALALAGWSASYLGNRQLMHATAADLALAQRLQRDSADLASRMKAMEVLQTRIEQLDATRASRPVLLALGLYEGDAIERKLRDEYFSGLRQLMLQPTAQAIEGYLTEVNQNAAALQPITRLPTSGAAPLAVEAGGGAASAPVAVAVTTPTPVSTAARAAGPTGAPALASRFVAASPTSVEDAYNALKTYLMLAERPRMEAGHLTDQVTRFWRGWLDDNRGTMPRDELIRSAERMLAFALANLGDPAFPQIDDNFALVDATRENLRRVVRGMPARERIYADVKARANTRYPPLTVAGIVGGDGREVVHGSYAIPGAFTVQAWKGYVEDAFRNAAAGELQTVDWVLKTSARDDLSLAGSPDQIRKALTDLYKTEYVREWQRFLQGVSVADFGSFDVAVARLNRLGDPADSPIRKLMKTLYEQVSWDNPSLLNERLAQTQRTFSEWIQQTILRQAPARVQIDVDVRTPTGEIPMGPVGREFAALSRLMMARDNAPTPLDGYLNALGAVRTRFNTIKLGGDPGVMARELMAATLDGSGSELAQALRFVDEQMLAAQTDTARAALRPLLVRPLMQAYAVLIPPVETALNREWQAMVYEPFSRALAGRFPFSTAPVEAAPGEIAKVFGPTGSIAAFGEKSLGRLVHRDSATIRPRTWADMGLALRPEFAVGYPRWVAALDGIAGAGAAAAVPAAPGAAAAAAAAQTVFQILPQGAPGFTEYTIEIDGQRLRYRNSVPSWTDFFWPNPAAAPGARISGVTLDGRTVEVFNQPGASGLTRLFETARQLKLPDGSNELTWGTAPESVVVHLRRVRAPGPVAGEAPGAAPGPVVGAHPLRGLKLPPVVAGAGEGVPGVVGAASASIGTAPAPSLPASTSTSTIREAAR